MNTETPPQNLTDKENRRRWELIKKKNRGWLTQEERAEFADLQGRSAAYHAQPHFHPPKLELVEKYAPVQVFASTLWLWFWRLLTLRPHEIISRRATGPYLLRWYVFPKIWWFRNFAVYAHKFVADDEDEALHDHPRPSWSWLFKGRYKEITPEGEKIYTAAWLWQRPTIIRRSAEMSHRIELIDKQPAWTLFIMGRWTRKWGFHCPNGWTHFQTFHDNIERTGKGCD
jgi:hypothetical protein